MRIFCRNVSAEKIFLTFFQAPVEIPPSTADSAESPLKEKNRVSRYNLKMGIDKLYVK